MIYQKLFITEQKIKRDMKTARKKLKAVDGIKCLLEQLDQNVEVMLVSDIEKLDEVLADLKEDKLSKYEKIVLQEML